MNKLSAPATKVFLELVQGLAPGEAKVIDKASGVFMAVHVDCLRAGPAGSLYAVAHRFEQNGDLCPDPDVEFYVVDDALEPGSKAVYPTAIDQPLSYRRHVEFGEDSRPSSLRPKAQADLASFCNGWMRNIRDQQGLGGKVGTR